MHRFRPFLVFLLAIGLSFCGEGTPESTVEPGVNTAATGGETQAGSQGEQTQTTIPGSNTGGTSSPGTVSGGGTTSPAILFGCNTGAQVAEGNNQMTIGGQGRSFEAYLPNVTAGTPVAVVFGFHGTGMNPSQVSSFAVAGAHRLVDADPNFPYVFIAPQGLALWPWNQPRGAEWASFEFERNDGNIEAALFEEVLGCLSTSFTIDTQRIYVLGFSGGAILANALHSRYPEMVAAVASLSGAWFNDPNTVDDIQMGFLKSQINMKWDDLKLSDTGAVLQTHGGEGRDVWPQPGGMDSQLQMAGIQPDENGQVRIISFENSAQFAKDFLPAHNRTLVDCAHENGHTNHPGIWGSVVIDFLKIHKAGTQSPILTDGLPAGIAPHCTLVNQ